MKTHFIFLTLLISTIMGCNKTDDEFSPSLPAITAEGKNTFGAYVDGTLVTPRNGEDSFNQTASGMILYSGPGPDQYNYYDLKVRDYQSSTGALFILHIEPLQDLHNAMYTIEESNCMDTIGEILNPNITIRCRLYDPISKTIKWYCSQTDSGVLTISKYDIDNRILSGTFHCTAVNRDNPDEIIEITQGRFDLKWDELAYVTFP
ncbi:MAG: hypothetical protein K0U54_12460 [Bacteroidetes bacterium]|nr:hypothetical protein [Bacteroidota bacterium]